MKNLHCTHFPNLFEWFRCEVNRKKSEFERNAWFRQSSRILGGWPTFQDFAPGALPVLGVAHPCVLCKGGRPSCRLRLPEEYKAKGASTPAIPIPDDSCQLQSRRKAKSHLGLWNPTFAQTAKVGHPRGLDLRAEAVVSLCQHSPTGNCALEAGFEGIFS